MLLKGLTCSLVRFFSHYCNCTYGHTVDTTLLAYIPHQSLASSIYLGHDNHRSTLSNHISQQPVEPLLYSRHIISVQSPLTYSIRKPLSIREPLFGQTLSGQAVVGEQRAHGIGHCTVLTGA